MNNNRRLDNYTKNKKSPAKPDGTLDVTPTQARRMKHKGGAKAARDRKAQEQS
jgi:hypothetical protein